ncbi:SNF2-related protein [Nocardiopsis sp. YSL2]|uniref:SNF2-related protein n=1 Tax=Nocardiopsis sp. YSL2 TaxID=2939492 RepID=UPI0026F436F1|nr:SNF2-related protein [Nocardiopsis sp. YSL2]
MKLQLADDPIQIFPRALSMPRTNLLIADDVGLGKTIEAGLVIQALNLRHRARTMLIVCPAGLTTQWHDGMRDKFGLEFRLVVDTALLRRLRRERGLCANPWTHYPRLIVSIDWLKRECPRRLLREIRGEVTVGEASELMESIRLSGMRLPFPKRGFEHWARAKGLFGQRRAWCAAPRFTFRFDRTHVAFMEA